MAGGHNAALLHGIVQQCERRCSAVRTALFESHDLEYFRNAVSYCRRGRKREIDHAERHAEAARRLLRDKLAHTRYLERRLFYSFRNNVERLPLAGLERMRHNARPGHADIYNALRLAHAVERSGHERVVLHGVGKYHELCAAHRVYIRRFTHDTSHECDRVHIYARSCRRHIDAGAYESGLCERLWDRTDKPPVALREALMRKRRKTANEVDSEGVRRLVERQRQRNIVLLLAARRDK